jgi:antitoxin (DNA-binding transcriptional repressor) of toxin-antitoxin stability system
MKEVGISEFRVKCFAIIERVCKARQPIRVTRFGVPLAEIIPPTPANSTTRRLGGMVGTGLILGDIVGPTGSLSDWNAAAEADGKERSTKKMSRKSKAYLRR